MASSHWHIQDILQEHGSVPVGRMGSLLHDAINNHSLPSMIKERYGGLKKFLETHSDVSSSFLFSSCFAFVPALLFVGHCAIAPDFPPAKQVFSLGTDHRFNPHVSLRSAPTSSPTAEFILGYLVHPLWVGVV